MPQTATGGTHKSYNFYGREGAAFFIHKPGNIGIPRFIRVVLFLEAPNSF
jgi:hypothetical protein